MEWGSIYQPNHSPERPYLTQLDIRAIVAHWTGYTIAQSTFPQS